MSILFKYTINSNILCILEKKILYTSNGGGQMIVWPPEFPVWEGPWPLGPPPWVRHWPRPSSERASSHYFGLRTLHNRISFALNGIPAKNLSIHFSLKLDENEFDYYYFFNVFYEFFFWYLNVLKRILNKSYGRLIFFWRGGAGDRYQGKGQNWGHFEY